MKGMILTDSSIIDLINELPVIIGYIVNGYIFISVLFFIARFRELESGEKVISSLVMSYLLNMAYEYSFGMTDRFNKSTNPLAFFWLSLLITLLLALVFGNIFKSKIVHDKMMNCKFIQRSLSQDFWQDEFVSGVYYRFHIKESDMLFEGQVIDQEEGESRPFVRIDHVRILRADTEKVIHDYNSQSINKEHPNTIHTTMLINLDEVDYIVAINTNTANINY